MMSLDTQNRELIVRKRKAQFIEKALQFCGYDFRHDDYKHVVYAESGYKTQSEEKAKNLYDAYSFLLSNAQNPFSASMLKRFFYILTGKEADEALIIRMITRFLKESICRRLKRPLNIICAFFQNCSGYPLKRF